MRQAGFAPIVIVQQSRSEEEAAGGNVCGDGLARAARAMQRRQRVSGKGHTQRAGAGVLRWPADGGAADADAEPSHTNERVPCVGRGVGVAGVG